MAVCSKLGVGHRAAILLVSDLILISLVLLTACVPSSTPSDSDSDVVESPTSSVASVDQRDDGPWIIRWLLALGPAGPVGNGDLGHELFPQLKNGECDEAADLPRAGTQEELLYGAAGRACLAAFEGRAELWPIVEEDLAALDLSQLDPTCYDRAVHQLLQALVELHRRDPDRQFSKAAVNEPAEADRCPRLTAIDPQSGSLSGGYQVSLTGTNLTEEVTLHLGFSSDESLDFEAQPDGRRITFTMPPADEPGEVWIVVQLPDDVHSALPFTYESEASAEPSTEATDQPSGEPSDQPS